MLNQFIKKLVIGSTLFTLMGSCVNIPGPTQAYQSQTRFQDFAKLSKPVFGDTAANLNKLKSNLPKDTFRFVLLGDNRNSSPVSSGGNKVYRKVIAKVNELKPDFAMSNGDFTYDNLPHHHKTFENITANIKVPFLTAVGNHDVIWGRSYYESRFTPPNPETGLDDYAFDYQGAHFVILDTANMTITERQFKWFDQQTQTAQPTFVLSHATPLYGNWKHSHSPSPEVTRRWMSLMEKNTVDYVLLGHIHLYDEAKINGVQYIVSGGAGAPLKTKLGYGRPVHHVVAFTVSSNHITHQMIPVDSDEMSR